MLGEALRVAGRYREALEALQEALDSPFFGRVGRSRLLRGGLRAYWRMVTALLGNGSRSADR